jgi:hypothetical protein
VLRHGVSDLQMQTRMEEEEGDFAAISRLTQV